MTAKKREDNKLKADFFLLAGVVLALVLSSHACMNDTPPAPPPVKKAVKAPGKKASPALKTENKKNAAESTREYSYNPNGKIDPFVPLVTTSPMTPMETAEPTKKDVPLSPLQKLDIDDFTLVAIIGSEKELTALLEDPAMHGFIVKEGMLIGRHNGVIRKILPTSILIEEQFTDEQDKKEVKIKTITLKNK